MIGQQQFNDPRPSAKPTSLLRSARRHAFRWLLGLMVSLSFAGQLAAQTQEIELEYKLKAAFLYNFAKFTHWPTNKFVPPEPSIIVACMADDPAGPLLAHALEGKMLNGVPIKVKFFDDADDLRKCHLLFLGRSKKAQIDDILGKLTRAPVLTVSEVEQFGQRGGMINFFRHERTFRFEINLEAAERSQLRISSDLSSMATLVKPDRQK